MEQDEPDTQTTTIDEQIKVSTFTITNMSTGEKINFGEVNFCPQTEEITKYKTLDGVTHNLTSIVQSVSDKLNWIPSEQVIIALIKPVTGNEHSFSYGVSYYCVRDIAGNVTDMCIKNSQNCYIPVMLQNQEIKTYEYDQI